MENTHGNCNGAARQRHLFNTGGPRSRVRSERIASSIFDSEALKTLSEIHFLDIPEEVIDIEKWVISLYRPGQFSDWSHVIAALNLPTVRMLVMPVEITAQASLSSYAMFRSAVILSKCSNNYYAPDSPMIFTRNRLNRTIELIKINLNSYYGMD